MFVSKFNNTDARAIVKKKVEDLKPFHSKVIFEKNNSQRQERLTGPKLDYDVIFLD